jgi:hypothetical protein
VQILGRDHRCVDVDIALPEVLLTVKGEQHVAAGQIANALACSPAHDLAASVAAGNGLALVDELSRVLPQTCQSRLEA